MRIAVERTTTIAPPKVWTCLAAAQQGMREYQGIPLRTPQGLVFLEVIPILIPCLPHQQVKHELLLTGIETENRVEFRFGSLA